MNDSVYHKKLARALDRMGGLYTVHDILARIAAGDMQSFAHGNSWVITSVVDYPRRRVLDVLVAVGDIDDILFLHDVVVDYASKVNASLIRAYGRPGWDQFVKQHKWRVVNHVYYKEM